MRTVVLMTAAALLLSSVLQCSAQSAQGASNTQARFAYCQGVHGDDMRPGWLKNHCSKAPYGVRFERLRPAWECLGMN